MSTAAIGLPGRARPVAADPWRALERRTTGYRVVLLLWMVLLFEPHWWVAKVGPDIATKLPLVMFVATAIVTVQHLPKGRFLPPFLAWVALSLATFRFAANPGYAEIAAKQLGMYYIMALGVAAFVKTPRLARPLIMILMGWQYLWWILLGIKIGRIRWHPLYANFDGFGPLAVIGLAASFHLATAVRSRPLKVLFFATSALCAMGIVSAYARGAALSAIAVVAFAWIRSNRKGLMTAGIVVALMVATVASAIIFAGARRGRGVQSTFFAELMTVADTGGTRGDREVLWGAAIELWQEEKLFGVGARSFGVAAARHFKPGEIGGDYSGNPLVLYDRALHNVFVQVLCEYGLVGAVVFLWLFIDFWKRNWMLQSKAAATWWKSRDPAINVHAVALGLESMMVAFIVNGVFYNQLECNWLYTIMVLNGALHRIVSTGLQQTAAPRAPAAVPVRGSARVGPGGPRR